MQFKNTDKTSWLLLELVERKLLVWKLWIWLPLFHCTESTASCFSPVLSRQIFTKIASYSNWLCKFRKDNIRKTFISRLHVLILVDKNIKLEIFGYLAIKQQGLLIRTLSCIVPFEKENSNTNMQINCQTGSNSTGILYLYSWSHSGWYAVVKRWKVHELFLNQVIPYA